MRPSWGWMGLTQSQNPRVDAKSNSGRRKVKPWTTQSQVHKPSDTKSSLSWPILTRKRELTRERSWAEGDKIEGRRVGERMGRMQLDKVDYVNITFFFSAKSIILAPCTLPHPIKLWSWLCVSHNSWPDFASVRHWLDLDFASVQLLID